ncbi:CRISPR-associated endonuclease Cas2 [Candidatus Kaiserbacteria bacterium RIFCSPHIGHO2_02_FULL_49_11]|uniref:CRISPR-associated endonuclease Cas2 n=1 Tax=Candidatus Kaiserbacteria bacterium RIFCSPHIGHO2_02_FULL_49_11 TaxID=1798489 RepID=A0A1F6D142_9BACT|nr:MAG: CRISPR-associated endonuclease Cas2 [Candidatus Kaiserbacteria bacterium RIFCSPHIGHO2_02_FULL_49_11]
MGTKEIESRKRKRRGDLKLMVLQSIMAAGLLRVAALAPNVIGAMGKMGLLPSKQQANSIHNARRRLVAEGLLVYKDNNLCVTERGERALRLLEIKNYPIKKPRRWDGRWRVLIFDIPERKKRVREQVRRTLHTIGFIRLQDSVWLYPYDCEDIITLFKADLGVGREILYMIVDTLEYDTPYRKHFALKG